MRSCFVVTSWWSNCLALTAIRHLMDFAPGRDCFVMQAGKSDEQMERFRSLLPPYVTELHYPSHLPADDSPMREYLVRESLRDQEGVWFLDHDAFLLAPATVWFEAADMLLETRNICFCSRQPSPGSGITMPLYWASPARWPQGLSSFAPIPFQPKPSSRRPDLYRHEGGISVPLKDTLVQVREELDARNMAGTLYFGDSDRSGSYLLPAFPTHQHLGGLHLYTKPAQPPPNTPPAFYEWRRGVVTSFERFFNGCPKAWLDNEDPELLRRHRELRELMATS